MLLPMDIAMDKQCACGYSVRNCGLWSEVGRQLHLRLNIDLMQNPYAFPLGYVAGKDIDPLFDNALYSFKSKFVRGARYLEYRINRRPFKFITYKMDEMARNNFAIYDLVREIQKKQVVIDSSKHYVAGTNIYKTKPSEVRIILLTRDGRGVFYSGIKHGFGKELALTAWKNHYERGLPLLQKQVRPEHLLRVKYEDLVVKPEETLKTVCNFLELDFEENMLSPALVQHHNINGNYTKFSNIAELRLDNAWVKKLSEDDLAYFECHAGNLNRKLGYTHMPLPI